MIVSLAFSLVKHNIFVKKLFYSALIIFCSTAANAQKYALFNTKTLFDAFENPAQKAFTLDSSRKYASNFLLPYFSFNALNKGTSEPVIRNLSQTGVFDARSLPILKGDVNTFYQNTNIYVFTYRIFKSHQYNKELGFAWQIQSDSYINYPNEILAIQDSYKLFTQNKDLDNIFNTNGYAQSYHQFSINYREDFDKQLSFGIKASILSGITYNKLKINQSYLNINTEDDKLNIGLNGLFRSSYYINPNSNDATDLKTKSFLPNFKNLGIAFSFGTSYKSKNGLYFMGNLKDLGFIRWGKSSYETSINDIKTIDEFSTRTSSYITNEFRNLIFESNAQKTYTTLTNAKADFLVSKIYAHYKPSLVVSKNLFYKGGDIAFVNTFSSNTLSASITPSYNFSGAFLMGLQGMIKTPNFEFFLGTDNILSTYYQTKGTINRDGNIGKGYNGASVYLGLGIKFGEILNHPLNSSTMPGVDNLTYDNHLFKGFGKLFKFFKRKKNN